SFVADNVFSSLTPSGKLRCNIDVSDKPVSGGFIHWVHAMFEHLEPCSSVGFIVEVQLLYHLTRKLDATKSTRRDDILVGYRKLVDVKVLIAVVGDHSLQVVFGIARMSDVFCQSGSSKLQGRATNRADRNSPRVKPLKERFQILVRFSLPHIAA